MSSFLPQIPWQIKYTRRRGSIALRIDRDKLWVLAPKRTAIRSIEKLLMERKEWIEQSFEQQQARPSTDKTYQQGEPWLVQGQRYPLTLFAAESGPTYACLDQGQLKLYLSPDNNSSEQCAELLRQWYLDQALQHWPARLEHWSQRTGLLASGLKIRHYKSRWGSCNCRGQITLNSLLWMAPIGVLDYIIVHELCHLQHPNHSIQFWQLVERYLPDWQLQRRWLRQHQTELQF